jgi:hypothetical protein
MPRKKIEPQKPGVRKRGRPHSRTVTNAKEDAAKSPREFTAYAIKDFRDASQYPRSKRLSSWRWEYLRRNPAYQSYFETHKSGLETDTPTHSGRELLSRFGIRSLYDPRQDEYPPGAFYTMTGGAVIRAEEISRIAAGNLQLAKRAVESGISAVALLFDHIMRERDRYPHGTVLVVIDTTLPLEPQFAVAQKTIEEHLSNDARVPALRNHRIAEWRGYLRVLDARAAGEAVDDIAAIVYPETDNSYEDDYKGRKRVENAYRRGTRLAATFGVRGFGNQENYSVK